MQEIVLGKRSGLGAVSKHSTFALLTCGTRRGYETSQPDLQQTENQS